VKNHLFIVFSRPAFLDSEQLYNNNSVVIFDTNNHLPNGYILNKQLIKKGKLLCRLIILSTKK